MEKVILLQGDSITDSRRERGSDDFPGHGYATMVKGAVGAAFPGKYTIYNRGISGNRIVDVYARIKADIINLKPDVMSILIGVNDVWHELNACNGVDAPKFERIYGMLIEEIKEACPDITIAILEPFVLRGTATDDLPEYPGRYDDFRAGVELRAQASRRIAEKYDLIFIPLQERFDKVCESAPESYWLFDGVHPTPMGHDIIKQAWLEALGSVL